MSLFTRSTDSNERDGLILHPTWQGTAPEEHPLGVESWWFQYIPARYNKGRMAAPPGVCLSVVTPRPFAGSVLVCPEDNWDRGVKILGVCREFQTDVREVDAAFMLSGHVGDDLAGYFRSAVTHQALRELFHLNFNHVEFFDGRIAATCRPWVNDIPESDPPSDFKRVATSLFQLRSGLSLVPPGSPSPGSRFHHAIDALRPGLWALTGVLGAAAILCAMIVTTFLSVGELLSQLGGRSALAGLAAALTFAVFSRRYAFRGRMLVATLFAVFAIVSSGTLSTLDILNEQLDASPAVEHSEVIQRKWITHSRHGSTYHIATRSWRPDHGSESFTLPAYGWNQVRTGQSRYVVHSKAGRFGVEWLQDQALYR
jgi:hypothetical protein